MNAPQPPPANTDGLACWTALIAEGGFDSWFLELVQERDRMGRAKYGVPLVAWNGRDAVVDAMQEALDLVVYLQQALMRCPEPDGREWKPYNVHDRLRQMRNVALMLVRDLKALEGRVPVQPGGAR